MTYKLAATLAALVLTALTAVLCGAAEQFSAPRMILEETSFDFQEVDEGAVLEHDFVVRNAGDQPLEIQKVIPV